MTTSEFMEVHCHLGKIEYIIEIKEQLSKVFNLFNDPEAVELVNIEFNYIMFNIRTTNPMDFERIQQIQEILPNYSFRIVESIRDLGHYDTRLRAELKIEVVEK